MIYWFKKSSLKESAAQHGYSVIFHYYQIFNVRYFMADLEQRCLEDNTDDNQILNTYLLKYAEILGGYML